MDGWLDGRLVGWICLWVVLDGSIAKQIISRTVSAIDDYTDPNKREQLRDSCKTKDLEKKNRMEQN